MASKKSKKIKVGVIFGGRSGEHEVSIVSGQSVMKALDKKKYQAVPIGITRQGKWLTGTEAIKYLKSEIKKLPVESYLPADPGRRQLVSLDKKGSKVTPVDVVFPVLHGTYGEDGTIQGLFEMANVPYVGSGVLGSALGMDKVVQKQLLSSLKLPLVPYVWFYMQEWKKGRRQIIKNIFDNLKYPIFVKPANLGSSVGITKVKNHKQLELGVSLAGKFDQKIIVEQAVIGARELECAVLGNLRPKASVVGEIVASNEFYDYHAKYVGGESKEIIPAKISQRTADSIKQMALLAFKTLNCYGLARVDFFLSKGGKVYLNELNTMPGFTSISMYSKLWSKTGVPYQKLVSRLIDLAIARHNTKNKLQTDFASDSDWYKQK
ncbi:MAG: D-alanine--D-alanine ligase A [Candidatus Buchananbacteria bacterium CG10_big_fil_rev_8_21_14_0_10_42_9]|uniref:D-alanine--D-alanine ligase n=1 Tax=Candidatus Buchananbacteria bacterium CG10_big_fil_rev_8_21_14_0_10_42_9 TaxID=1974526 RepID=A0A2H0W2C6_9BACT|nr:MAG: D-alanine--D-alanine ligase A [Candidatus Buchananbacteria bacterium CG10_big_fil_rev_8_21_14_0_10_42_9]